MVLYKAHCFLSSLPWKLLKPQTQGLVEGLAFPELAGLALVVTWSSLGLCWVLSEEILPGGNIWKISPMLCSQALGGSSLKTHSPFVL